MGRPLRVCAEPGCSALVPKGFCIEHKKKRRSRDTRESSAKRGYGRRWRKLRKIVLARDPICTICGEAPATEAHHIIPRAPGELAADVTEDDLTGVCKPCHSRTTQAERARKSNNDRALDGGGKSWAP